MPQNIDTNEQFEAGFVTTTGLAGFSPLIHNLSQPQQPQLTNMILINPDRSTVTGGNVRTARTREREIEWLNAHQEQYPGEWVVVEGEEVVAHGMDYVTVRTAAVNSGIEVPFIVFVPERPFPYHVMGL